jgi:hypothetical protein
MAPSAAGALFWWGTVKRSMWADCSRPSDVTVTRYLAILLDSEQDVGDLETGSLSTRVAEMVRSGSVDETMLAVAWSDLARIQRIVEIFFLLPVSVRLLPDSSISKFPVCQ